MMFQRKVFENSPIGIILKNEHCPIFFPFIYIYKTFVLLYLTYHTQFKHQFVTFVSGIYGQFTLKRRTKASSSTTGLIYAPQPISKASDCLMHFKNVPQMIGGSKIIHNPSTGNCSLVPVSAGNYAEATDAAYNLYSYILENHEGNYSS